MSRLSNPGPSHDHGGIRSVAAGALGNRPGALDADTYRPCPVRRVVIVRRVALGCIPCSAGRNLEECFWV